MTRIRLETTRKALTHRFKLGEHKGYVTVGFYEDGKPGELFIRMAQTGSTINGLLDAWAITFSIALQNGVALSNLCHKLERMRFEPEGFTGSEFGFATSVVDYVCRWLLARCCK